jgi:hypothetical protein
MWSFGPETAFWAVKADLPAKRLIRTEELGTESGDNHQLSIIDNQLKCGKSGFESSFAKATADLRYLAEIRPDTFNSPSTKKLPVPSFKVLSYRRDK